MIPDEGWAVYWDNGVYGGILRADGQEREFAHYVIVAGRRPFLRAVCPGGGEDDDLGPGTTVLLSDAQLMILGIGQTDEQPYAALSGNLQVSDANRVLDQWYESKAGWGFWGHWSPQLSDTVNNVDHRRDAAWRGGRHSMPAGYSQDLCLPGW